MHLTGVPFMRYSGHRSHEYADYYNKAHRSYIRGKVDDGYTVPTTMRPSNFPAPLQSRTVVGEPPAFMPLRPIMYSNRQTQDVYVLPSEVCYAPPAHTWKNSMGLDESTSSSSIPGIEDDAEPGTTSLQSTVTQPRTFANATNVLTTFVSTSGKFAMVFFFMRM